MRTASFVVSLDLDALPDDLAEFISTIMGAEGIVATGDLARLIAAAIRVGHEEWGQHRQDDVYAVRLTVPEDLRAWWMEDGPEPMATAPWTLDEAGTRALLAAVTGRPVAEVGR